MVRPTPSYVYVVMRCVPAPPVVVPAGRPEALPAKVEPQPKPEELGKALGLWNLLIIVGFIAGAGIVVRNSIILVDFIELRVRDGMPLHEAVVDAGATNWHPERQR